MNTARKTALLKRLKPHREGWGPRPTGVTPEPAGPGEESVWDYPRPPLVRDAPGRVVVRHGGLTVADTDRAREIIETAGAPVPYIPPDDVRLDLLRRARGSSLCEWKGEAIYFDVVTSHQRARKAAFTYPDPLDDLERGYAGLAGWIAFYPGLVDEAWVDDLRARPQPGGLYAGWVTDRIKGPIKGVAGTERW